MSLLAEVPDDVLLARITQEVEQRFVVPLESPQQRVHRSELKPGVERHRRCISLIDVLLFEAQRSDRSVGGSPRTQLLERNAGVPLDECQIGVGKFPRRKI